MGLFDENDPVTRGPKGLGAHANYQEEGDSGVDREGVKGKKSANRGP